MSVSSTFFLMNVLEALVKVSFYKNYTFKPLVNYTFKVGTQFFYKLLSRVISILPNV